jgi:magnesium chelatase subunit D
MGWNWRRAFCAVRCNVPLAASRAGSVEGPVAREGVNDALNVARTLRALRRVDAFVLNPRPRAYAELPLVLADALGATTQEVLFCKPTPRYP